MMKNISQEFLQQAKGYVSDEIAKREDRVLPYHSLEHFQYVTEAVGVIGKECKLSDAQLKTAKLAAIFHDIGYIKGSKEHEERSCKIAGQFLEKHQIDSKIIEEVKAAIMSTKIPQQPKDIVAAVVCDADLHHLSSPDYYEHAEKMRKESSLLNKNKVSKQDFDKMSVLFFEKHHYHTEYGRTVLEKLKQKNLDIIKANIKKRADKPDKQSVELQKELDKLQKKIEKQKGYSRGVESMFRLTARNQISLSAIADNKSNILISVNTIIISIVLTVLVSRFGEYPHLIIPSLIFLLVSLVTIIFAILSTRPNVNSGRFSKKDIEDKKVNLIFFGNFYNMELDDYSWALEEMMKDDDYLYSTMIKDQYYLGKVLAKKYKLLRKAYNFFMFGLVISVIAYIISFMNI